MAETYHLPDVTFITGPMASGKSGRLFGNFGRFEATGVRYRAFKPSLDVREAGIRPRGFPEDKAYPSEVIDSLTDIDAAELAAKGITSILGDEAHMWGFKPNREPLLGVYLPTLIAFGKAGIKSVYLAGLNIAASGREFSIYSDAFCNGADIVALTADCTYPGKPGGPTCGKLARNSQIYPADQEELAYAKDSLPDLMPQGGIPGISFRPVCPDHNNLVKSLTIDFSLSTPTNHRSGPILV
jgi:thymidine kinase